MLLLVLLKRFMARRAYIDADTETRTDMVRVYVQKIMWPVFAVTMGALLLEYILP